MQIAKRALKAIIVSHLGLSNEGYLSSNFNLHYQKGNSNQLQIKSSNLIDFSGLGDARPKKCNGGTPWYKATIFV